MRLSFRQGIARYQTDVVSSPSFLQKSSNGNYVNLIVSPTPTIIVFAHKGANYVVEEVQSVTNAWGPIPSVTCFLYWDINLITAALSRGITTLPPIYSAAAPSTPAVDQHWFDLSSTTMKVWSGSKWLEKVRVFAGSLSSGSILTPYQAGISQVGLVGEYDAGNIILDSYNKPLRQSDGTFVTSATNLILTNNSSKSIRLEGDVLSGQAIEPIPKFSFVQVQPNRTLELARSSDYMSRISGIVLEDLYTNEIGTIVSAGLIRNELWNFDSTLINRPIFCGQNGEVQTTPPTTGVLQQAGFVYDTDSIFINIFAPIILDYPIPAAPIADGPTDPPIASFYTKTVSGTAPFTVQFVNTTLNGALSYSWDFNNDGTIDSTAKDPAFTYEQPGTYTVVLKTSNAYGQNTYVATNYITVLPATSIPDDVNLGVMLGGPNFTTVGAATQISLSVSNDGLRTATNVVRSVVIPSVNNQAVTVSSLPAGSTVTVANNITTVVFPIVSQIGSNLVYGPTLFTVTAPAAGTLKIIASTSCDQPDVTLGDNTSTIEIGVR
jgi:PKD repeat protein